MKEIEKWISKLNSQQKIIFAIVVPVGLLVLFYPIADAFDDTYRSQPFRFEYTWWVWLIYVGIVGFIEYKLFENTEK
jgi:uncharacterized membrane protein